MPVGFAQGKVSVISSGVPTLKRSFFTISLATRLRCSRPEGTREGMEGVITDLAYSSSRQAGTRGLSLDHIHVLYV